MFRTDKALYSDKRGTITKGLLQDVPGVVNPASFTAFRAALAYGNFEAPGVSDPD
jgi:hypothetical protein